MDKIWSAQDEEFLLKNHDSISRSELAEKFKVSEDEISSKVEALLQKTGDSEVAADSETVAASNVPESAKPPSEKADSKGLEETVVSKEILIKGMERLSGSKDKVESSITIMTEEGWKPVLIKREKITY